MKLTRDRHIVFILASFGLLALVMGILATQPSRAAEPWYMAAGDDDGYGSLRPGAAYATLDAANVKRFSALTEIRDVERITESLWMEATVRQPPLRMLGSDRSQPEITVAPLVLSATLGLGEESTRTLTLSNGGGLDLSWALEESPEVVWLAEEPVSGTVPPDGVAAVGVAFDVDGLSDGIYATTLQVSNNDPDEPQIDVSVVLTVAPCIPVAGADFDYEPPDPQGGELVEFVGAVSQSSGILGFRWSFGDGDSGAGQQVNHRFPLCVITQTYTVVLTVSGCVNQDTVGRDVTVRPSGDPIYVDAGATGGANNGTSWEDAFTDLQSALTDASSGDEIWVAAGIYRPTTKYGGSDERNRSFQLKNGVGLYGGFAGTETCRDKRSWVLHETVLSGDIGIVDVDSDNSYHVFYHPADTALDSTAILDGFTITGGKADGGSFPHDSGGGMFNEVSSPALTNCTFSRNSARLRGGGMHNDGSSPVLANCTFDGNVAGNVGGGMSNQYSSSPTLSGCTFGGNSANFGGGGMFNLYSSPVLTNGTFDGNLAGSLGSGMYNDSSSPRLTNCTFSGNSAGAAGGGMYNWYSSSPTLTNCILWGDIPDEIFNDSLIRSPVVTYSNIQGGYGGEGNIDAVPWLADPDNGDVRLGACSPCIDRGDNLAPDLPEFDFEGDDRILDGDGDGVAIVDMGVDEVSVIGTCSRVHLPLTLRGY